MKKYIASLLLVSSLFFLACGNAKNDSAEAAKKEDRLKDLTTHSTSVKMLDTSLVDNKKDPSCGMPVSAGIIDTAHYKNLVLGFCSTECKADFLKNPKAMLAAAGLK